MNQAVLSSLSPVARSDCCSPQCDRRWHAGTPARSPHRRLCREISNREATRHSEPNLPKVQREKIIEISVVAATGGKPIERFRVVAGHAVSGGNGPRCSKRAGVDTVTAQWQPHTLRIGTNGRLDWPLTGWDELILRVEADGYQMQCSKWIKKGAEPPRLEFRLVQDWGVWGRVLRPDGEPAAGANIGMTIPHQYLAIRDGKIHIANQPPPKTEVDRWRLPKLVDADADGRFVLPFESDAAAMVSIVHESGVRRIPYAEFQRQPEVTLQEWGRVEGRMLWGDKPGANRESEHGRQRGTHGQGWTVRLRESRAGPAAVSQADRTPAAARRRRQLGEPPGLSTDFEVKPGGVTHALLGGQGRTVRGRLTGRDSWDGVTMHFHPNAPHIGFPGDDASWQAFAMFRHSEIGPLFFRDGLKPNAGRNL